MSELSDSVRWGQTTIAFSYRFARRKTLAISVHPDLKVTVVAPDGTPPKPSVRKFASAATG